LGTDKVYGSLRIHVMLPKVAGIKSLQPLQVVGNDVIINITEDNLDTMFSLQSIELIRKNVVRNVPQEIIC